jgi:hypothetical protein
MSTPYSEIGSDPKEALRLYIIELQSEYYTWYDRASRRLKRWWAFGHATVILAGVLAAALAAVSDIQVLKDSAVVRVLLVILPIVGTMTSSIMLQTRVRDLLTLRSIGREAMQNLIAQAKADYALAIDNPKRLSEIHSALVVAVSKVEREQGAGFRSILPGQFVMGTRTDVASDAGGPPNNSFNRSAS